LQNTVAEVDVRFQNVRWKLCFIGTLSTRTARRAVRLLDFPAKLYTPKNLSTFSKIILCRNLSHKSELSPRIANLKGVFAYILHRLCINVDKYRLSTSRFL
jgi:hypothetical protein